MFRFQNIVFTERFSMTSLEHLTDEELHASALKTAQMDIQSQLNTVMHLLEVNRRRLFAQRGFSSIFEYGVKALGFSEPAASERVQAMRLIQTLPAAANMLQTRELSLSSAASIQKFIRKEERINQRVFTDLEKNQILSEVSGKSVRETAQILLTFASKLEPHVFKEKIVPLTPTRTQLTFFVDPEVMADIERFRDLNGNLPLEEIFKSSLARHLDRTDPLRKPNKARSKQSTQTSESVNSRYVSVSLLQALNERSGGRCEFVDTKTGRRCEGHHRLQVDHVIPFSFGGPTTLENARHVCPAHNRLLAIELVGEEKMKQFLF
jgi:hypothetical protein